ncbi:hypothetical protein AAZX31_06G077000 [Glycine max]
MSVSRLLSTILSKCSKHRLLDQGKQVHGAVEKLGFRRDLILSNDLIDMYAKCGTVDFVCMVFDRMPERNVVSWTGLMCGYLQNGDAKTPLLLFLQIPGVCAKSNFDWVPVVGNSMINMYSKCGMVVRNVISWNAMIAGYSNERNGEEALNLFREMQEKGEVPDRYTYSSSLKACSCAGAVGEGMQIHAALIKHGFPYLAQSAVAGALVDIYVKCRRMAEARRVFDRIEVKSMMSRSTVILGYAQEDNLTEAMDLFRELRESRYRMDGFVLSSLMGVFADFALVEQGKQMHAYTIKVPYGLLEMSVANSVLDMYMQCGLTDEADALFREMLPRNVVSWTVMITGYGKHACSHSGLIKEGKKYFSSLCSHQKIKPQVEHHDCVVDLLGRGGRLKEAKDLIGKMPLKPNVGIWQTLLSVCRMHGDVKMGKQSEKIRETVKRKGLKKVAGREIHEVLKEMEKRVKEEMGYVHSVKFSLHDVEEESKMESLRVHSEKLAIGLVLVRRGRKLKGQRVIRIFKNLRVCGDCHVFIKGLSKVLKIVFVVRDANRFHRFENGLCSCGDYW